MARRRTAIVLGSGLLDDIPLAALADAFEHVRLVDAVHLWPARVVASRFRNVEHLSLDIGGTARMLLEGTSEPEDTLTAICGRADVDLVISANLLSQLPILPLDWYDSRGRPGPPDLARSIVAAHVDALTRTQARVCLVTDVVERELGRAGCETDRLDLLHGLKLPPSDRVWDWDLAPFGETEPGRRLVHRVQAYPDWHRALRI
ncbi:hypothetical protein [Methylobacterium durans]|uniref:hypothetical protein n=1 Tax=Methylobacterium durans TaxID=2202825 RepID=UPI00268096CE